MGVRGQPGLAFSYPTGEETKQSSFIVQEGKHGPSLTPDPFQLVLLRKTLRRGLLLWLYWMWRHAMSIACAQRYEAGGG